MEVHTRSGASETWDFVLVGRMTAPSYVGPWRSQPHAFMIRKVKEWIQVKSKPKLWI